jgi:exo-1,4-beta-D-glucosaminidase
LDLVAGIDADCFKRGVFVIQWMKVFAVVMMLPSVCSAEEFGNNWRVRSSAEVPQSGGLISQASYQTDGWLKADIPSTVYAVLLQNGKLLNPFFGQNLLDAPGMNYPQGVDFTQIEMPSDSPFRYGWWYRKVFLAKKRGEQAYLQFDGINYAAEIWLNGIEIASFAQLRGSFRTYEFNVTKLLYTDGRPNVLAVEVFAPRPGDLSSTWVDWNPAPGDKNMGIYRPVRLLWSGPVALRSPQVRADGDAIQVSCELWNDGPTAQTGTFFASSSVNSKRVRQSVNLAAGEHKRVTLTLPSDGAKLWWPVGMGKQPLYRAKLGFKLSSERLSDHTQVEFGVRKVTSEIDWQGHRLFRVNGKPFFVRGAGWASDLFLRTDRGRQRRQLSLVKHLGLNSIRMEGQFEEDEFYSMADREGLMILTGWACCSAWEQSAAWTDQHMSIAEASLRSKLRALRNHPSILAWFYGSDNAPGPEVERLYLRVLQEENWPNPSVASARDETTLVGPTGMKMTGPYDYVPSSYWWIDDNYGGAFGFNTEASMGAAPPGAEALKDFLLPNELWPIGPAWLLHSAQNEFHQLDTFTRAVTDRHGPPTSLDDFSRKAQVLAYEGHRAMFEAYAARQFTQTTGVIQWMLNNSWPSFYWHLFDYFLRGEGAYFGAKKANEPLHLAYNPVDGSVHLIHLSNDRSYPHLRVVTRIFDFGMHERARSEKQVSIGEAQSLQIDTLAAPGDITTTYFVRLELEELSPKGAVLRTFPPNFYWFSKKREILDWSRTDFKYTPVVSDADLTDLQKLPNVCVQLSAKVSATQASVTLRNLSSEALAFFVQVRVVNADDEHEVLPAYWDDNAITLLPGETRKLNVKYERQSSPLRVDLKGWNLSAPRTN